MALQILKTLKKSQTQKVHTSRVDRLVWGPSIGLELVLDRWRQQGLNFRHLITEEQIHFQAYCQWLRPIRGEMNVQLAQMLGLLLKEVLPRDKGKGHALFYKDHKFREFGGRTKSYVLREGEDSFLRETWSQCSINWQVPPLSSTLDKVFKLKFDYSQRLWQVELRNGEMIEAKHIIFSGRPQELLQLWPDSPAELSSELTSAENRESTSSSKTNRKIFLVRWNTPFKVCDFPQTLFVPQSQTHDWGHFIGEFSPYDELKGQEFCFFFFVDEEELDAEELTRKFQSLKRTLARVFPELERVFVTSATGSNPGLMKESVMLMEDFSQTPIGLKEAPVLKQFPLTWVGPFAPSVLDFSNIDYSMIDGLVRDIASVSSLIELTKMEERSADFFAEENFHC